ncbi:MAG TPA: sodium:proton antiporter [Polyangia bacterium]
MHTDAIPLWAIFPFAIYLLLIALMPLVLPHFWESNRNKLIVAAIMATPVLAYLLGQHPEGAHLLGHAVREYLGFIALLTALFVITGGIYLRGSLAGTPIVNTTLLGAGALLASLIGTTGASVLLIRPLLRANASRQRVRHIVVFFIFIVSNAAGLLTPLGDPPLYLGFLRGVPFTWTLRLFPVWLLVNGILLLVFNLIDQMVLNREERTRPGAQLEDVQVVKQRLAVEGKINLLWLGGVVALVASMGAVGSRWLPDPAHQAVVQVVILFGLTFASLKTTPPRVHEANAFSWGPIAEVAAIFVGVFVTMIPALGYLEAHGGALGIQRPAQFFWASGLLSSFLDNAPTYLTFASLAVGVINETTGAALTADNLGQLAAHPTGMTLLAAISCGAVLMGAVTYIGNGPNFMVKAIAEQARVPMPGFFGYMLWSVSVLMPIFVLVTVLIF